MMECPLYIQCAHAIHVQECNCCDSVEFSASCTVQKMLECNVVDKNNSARHTVY